MKKIFIILFINIAIILLTNTTVNANEVQMYTQDDLTKIGPGDEFSVTIKLESAEDNVTIQCKLNFNEEKIQLIRDEYYEELAKVDIGEDISNVTIDKDGNFIINTLKGREKNNLIKVKFKVKENVKLINEKITLTTISSNVDFKKEEKCLLIGKQFKVNIILITIIIIAIIIAIIIKLKKTGEK